MKKILALILPLSMFYFTINAQKQGQERIDSMLVVLKSSSEDTNKVTLLNDICFTYYAIDPDVGLKFGNQALALAEKLKYKNGVAQANSRIGSNYFGKADYPNALNYWMKALKLNEELNNKRSIGINLGNIGNIYLQQNDMAKALDYYLRAVKLNEESGNKNALALNFGNIGTVYGYQLKYEQGLEYFLKALKIQEEIQDMAGIARSTISIANVYMGLKDYSKALDYNFRALGMVSQFGVTNLIATCQTNIAKTYIELATDTNKTQLDSLLKGNENAALVLAKVYSDSAIILFKEIGDINALYLTYQGLSDIQSLMGDKTGALDSYKNYALFKDSVFNMEKDKKLTETTMQYEFDKKVAATKAEQEKIDIRQRNIRNSILAGLAAALIFLVVVYRQRNKINKARKRSDELLLNILPAEVAEELKEKGSAEAQQIDSVTVLFTDFKGFTQLSEKLTPKQLVSEINECFSAFDNITQKYGIEKIKTIGDSYMAAGGLPSPNKTHAVDVVKAALDIQQFMNEHKIQKEKDGAIFFEIRIGIHSGPVVAGIVGIKKFAYDIWGDTVNTASRMESSGEVGQVNISGTTFELVKNNFNCIYRGKIHAKGKNEVEMYFVERAG